MASTDFSVVKMSGVYQNTANVSQKNAQDLGNLNGDKTDNSQEANPSLNKHGQSLSTGSGSSLSGQSKPSWLYR